MDSTKRLGAGPGGYVALKKHPFFNGIDWKNLRQSPAPTIARESNVLFSDDLGEKIFQNILTTQIVVAN